MSDIGRAPGIFSPEILTIARLMLPTGTKTPYIIPRTYPLPLILANSTSLLYFFFLQRRPFPPLSASSSLSFSTPSGQAGGHCTRKGGRRPPLRQIRWEGRRGGDRVHEEVAAGRQRGGRQLFFFLFFPFLTS